LFHIFLTSIGTCPNFWSLQQIRIYSENRKTIKGHRADSLAAAQLHSDAWLVFIGPARAAHGLMAQPRWARAQPVAPTHALGMAVRHVVLATWRHGRQRCSGWGGDVVASPAKGEGDGAMGSLTSTHARWERAVSRHGAPAQARVATSLLRRRG
jgi:hypothetical protein